MPSLSTHVLDTASGVPGAGIKVQLFRIDGQIDGESRHLVSEHITNADGRTDEPLLASAEQGVYEIVFYAGDYFRTQQTSLTDPPFIDVVPIRFGVGQDAHYHVPLLVSPWSFSTYRGS